MVLLDDMAGILAAWFSAAIALATLIIAIVSLFQTKKIKELIDITEALKTQNEEISKQTIELIKQTEINKDRFELESEIALYGSIPFFTPESHNRNIGDASIFTLTFRNKGSIARNVKIEKSADAQFKFATIFLPILSPGNTKSIDIFITPADRTKYDIEEITLRTTFNDDRNRDFYQNINYLIEENQLRISTPRLLKHM